LQDKEDLQKNRQSSLLHVSSRH